jgi:hypothetical protein
MADKTYPLKWESSSSGGTEDDLAPTELDPTEDAIVCKEVQIVADESTPKTSTVQQGLKTDGSNNLVLFDRNSGEKTIADLLAGGAVDNTVVGSLVIMPANITSVDNCFYADGSQYSKTTYPDLFAVYGYTFGGSGDNFAVPDLRGLGLRGDGTHSTVTKADGNYVSGPTAGTTQNDQIQGHHHAMNHGNTAGGSVSLQYGGHTTSTGLGQPSNVQVEQATTDSTYGTVRAGDETRPAAAGVRYFVRHTSESAITTPTGSIMQNIRSTVTGWICCDGNSVGNATSGADYAGDIYQSLYNFMWDLAGLSTTAGDPFVISSTKGASASADWTAGKTITIDFATNEVVVRQKGSGRNIGSYEQDAFQGHRHESLSTLDGAALTGQASTYELMAENGYSSSHVDTGGPISDGTNGTPRTASETRMKNVALNHFIKY